MIEASNVTVRFNGRTVLYSLSCEFAPGITSVVGSNGAGKSTLLRVLCSVLAPDAGTVSYTDDGGSEIPVGKASFKKRLAWVPQNVSLPGRSRVLDFLRYSGWLGGVDGDCRAVSEKAMQQVGLTGLETKRIGILSGGQQRRVMLASALVQDPDVLILDEPTVGLDPEQRDYFYNILKSIPRDVVCIVSTHLLEDVVSLGGHLMVMKDGRIVQEGLVEDLLRHVQGQDSMDVTGSSDLGV